MLKGFGSAALWSVAQTAVRLCSSFLSIKVTAVVLGPAGLALTGQIGNFVSLLQGTLGNGANTAMVNLSSQARGTDPERAQAVIGTALRVMVMLALVASALLLVLSRPLASWLLSDPAYAPVLMLLALVFPGVLLGQTALALFSVERRFELMAGANIGGTLLGAIFFVGLCSVFGLKGALAGTVLAFPAVFAAAWWLSRKAPATRLLSYWRAGRRGLLREIVPFYPMLLVHSISMPLAMLLVRDTMMSSIGATQAGLWQSAARLSDMYTMIVITTLSMYVLPTLSAARDEREFRALLVRLVAACLGLAALAAGTLFLLRDLVIHIVFTHAFSAVRDLWPWQLLGDVFLLAGWPMRSALTAQRRTVPYMAVEAGIGVGLVVLTHLLVPRYGAAGANMAYAVVWATVFFVLLALHVRTWRVQPWLQARPA